MRGSVAVCFAGVMIVLLLAIPLFSTGLDESLDLRFQGELISANLKDAPLKAILEKIKEEKGIWYRGKDSLLATKVSARFESLPMEEGLKRIFGRVSYGLFFNSDKKVAGINLIEHGVGTETAESKKPPVAEAGLPKQKAKPGANKGMFEVVPNTPPPVNPDAKPIDTTVVPNSPPPMNPNATTIDTTVVKGVSPPGVVEGRPDGPSGAKPKSP